MGVSQPTFRIKNSELFERSIRAGQVGNLYTAIADEVPPLIQKEFHGKLAITDNKDTIYRAFKDQSFKPAVFNTLVYYIVSNVNEGEKDKGQGSHTVSDLKDFFKSLELPEKRLTRKELDIYNSFLRKSVNDPSILSREKIYMRKNWMLVDLTESESVKEEPKKQPNKKYHQWLTVAIVSILLLSLTNFIYPFIPFFSNEKEVLAENCIFDTNDKGSYKILIIPFESKISLIAGKNPAIEIEDRLNALNQSDDLNISVHFCDDFVYDKSVQDGSEHDYYKRVMELYNADHIIYGSSADVSQDDPYATYIRINYQARPGFYVQEENAKAEHYDLTLIDFSELSNGELMGDIEYLVYMNMAIALSNQNRIKEAFDYLIAIEDVGADKVEYQVLSAQLNQFMGNNQYSLEWLETIDLKALNEEERYNVELLMAKNKIMLGDGQAMDHILTAKDKFPDKATAYAAFSYYYAFLDGDLKVSMDYIDQAYQLATTTQEKLAILSLKLQIQRSFCDNNGALSTTDTALSIDDQNAQIHFIKGQLLYSLERYDFALESLEKALHLNHSTPGNVHFLKARVYAALNQTTKAVASYDRALDYNPCHVESIEYVLKYYFNKMDYDISRKYLYDCLNVSPRNFRMLYYMFDTYYAENDTFNASVYLKKLNSISPTIYFYYDSQGTRISTYPIYDSLQKKQRKHFRFDIVDGDTLPAKEMIYTFELKQSK